MSRLSIKDKLAKSGLITIFSFIALVTAGGCHGFSGKIEIVYFDSEEISFTEAAELPEITKEKLAKIRLITDVKLFAESELNMAVTDNYTTYLPGKVKEPLWVLTVVSRNKLEVKLDRGRSYWTFYSKEDAEKVKKEMEDAGYDTYLRSARAYSTSGTKSDPILPIMLEMEDHDLISTIMHELAHSTASSRYDSSFNEGFASFVGDVGARRYVEKKFGRKSLIYIRLHHYLNDRQTFDRFVIDAAKAVADIYDSYGDDTEAARAKAFQTIISIYDSYRRKFHGSWLRDQDISGKVNNAWLASHITYSKTEPFADAFSSVGGKWADFVKVCQTAADGRNPFRKLAEIIAGKNK